jgi:hypothetical protein
LGLQTVNTTGTVAGTSIAGKPSVLTSYEPVTITNSQPSATPNPFQQMVVFNSTDPGFSSITTSNFGQNVEFFYYNGTVVPSWLQNYTSDNATWWLKIAAIPAGSSETIYVGFAPTTTNLFNTVNDGEAPQISSTYAEYDDGYLVFPFYDNFLNKSGLSFDNSNYLISNGLKIGNGNSVSSSLLFSNLSIMGLYAQFYTNQSASTFDNSIYIGTPNEYTLKLTTSYQKYMHFGGYPYSYLETPYVAINSTHFANFMIIPHNYTSQYGYYNNLKIGIYYVDAITNIQFNAAVVEPSSSYNSFIYIKYFFFASPLPNGVIPNYSIGKFS